MRSSSGYLFSWIGTLSISARPSPPLCVSFSVSLGSSFVRVLAARNESDRPRIRGVQHLGHSRLFALSTKFPRRSNFSNRLLLPVEVAATRCKRSNVAEKKKKKKRKIGHRQGTNQRMALPDLNFMENSIHASLIAKYILGPLANRIGRSIDARTSWVSFQLRFWRFKWVRSGMDIVSGKERERKRERWVHLARERLVLYSHDCGRLSNCDHRSYRFTFSKLVRDVTIVEATTCRSHALWPHDSVARSGRTISWDFGEPNWAD